MARDGSPTEPAATRSASRAESLARLDAHLIGSSAALRRLKSQLLGLAGLPFPVLFSGEPGSGRRRAARALHAIGPCPDAPLLELDARAAPPPGGLPARGAVIVTHVDALGPEAQSHWSRVARGRALGPRLLASASAAFPMRAFDDGFDPELAAALLRFAVQVPPLRQRRGDVPELACHFAAEIARELARPAQRLAESALAALREASWSGNVAELRRVVERALAFSSGDEVSDEEVGAVLCEVRVSVAVLRERHRSEERDALLRALSDHGGNIARAAQQLGRSRAALYRLAEKHGVALQSKRA
jgi:two-component system nitrogen regulation response regulator NtrX